MNRKDVQPEFRILKDTTSGIAVCIYSCFDGMEEGEAVYFKTVEEACTALDALKEQLTTQVFT